MSGACVADPEIQNPKTYRGRSRERQAFINSVVVFLLMQENTERTFRLGSAQLLYCTDVLLHVQSGEKDSRSVGSWLTIGADRNALGSTFP